MCKYYQTCGSIENCARCPEREKALDAKIKALENEKQKIKRSK